MLSQNIYVSSSVKSGLELAAIIVGCPPDQLANLWLQERLDSMEEVTAMRKKLRKARQEIMDEFKAAYPQQELL